MLKIFTQNRIDERATGQESLELHLQAQLNGRMNSAIFSLLQGSILEIKETITMLS